MADSALSNDVREHGCTSFRDPQNEGWCMHQAPARPFQFSRAPRAQRTPTAVSPPFRAPAAPCRGGARCFVFAYRWPRTVGKETLGRQQQRDLPFCSSHPRWRRRRRERCCTCVARARRLQSLVTRNAALLEHGLGPPLFRWEKDLPSPDGRRTSPLQMGEGPPLSRWEKDLPSPDGRKTSPLQMGEGPPLSR
eukprot:gene14021-biopygen15634